VATNGWRSGSDPVQRWLRVVTSIVFLAVVVMLATDADAIPNDDLPTLMLMLGSLFVLLGYEAVVRWIVSRLPKVRIVSDNEKDQEEAG
jgi:hypothetical protein